jgi:osmotically inducible protein OsmC
MAIRSAHTSWTGTLMEGSGRVELTSSGVGSFDVSFPKRTADNADGTTSPEELIAAAHSSCYSMALSGGIATAGGTPQSLEVTADVQIRPDPAGGLRITSIKLTVRGRVEGMDDEAFKAAAEGAKVGCPVSKALTGVDEITVDAALV